MIITITSFSAMRPNNMGTNSGEFVNNDDASIAGSLSLQMCGTKDAGFKSEEGAMRATTQKGREKQRGGNVR